MSIPKLIPTAKPTLAELSLTLNGTETKSPLCRTFSYILFLAENKFIEALLLSEG